MPKPESFPIDKIYVPVKRKKALKPELFKKSRKVFKKSDNKRPILVRPDEGRFVLIDRTASVRSVQSSWRKNYHRGLGHG